MFACCVFMRGGKEMHNNKQLGMPTAPMWVHKKLLPRLAAKPGQDQSVPALVCLKLRQVALPVRVVRAQLVGVSSVHLVRELVCSHKLR